MAISQRDKARALKAALDACRYVGMAGPQRARLWLVIRETVCTRGAVDIIPYGSSRPITVTEDYASAELLSAMEWLIAHENKARTLDAEALYSAMRCEATRSALGSARTARADLLHGMTGVMAGEPVRWVELDAPRTAS